MNTPGIDEFRSLAALLPDALLLVGPDGTVLAANPLAGEAMGLPVSALEGRAFAELVEDPTGKVCEYLRICSRLTEPVPAGFRRTLAPSRPQFPTARRPR